MRKDRFDFDTKIDLKGLYEIFQDMLEILEKKKQEVEKLLEELDKRIEYIKKFNHKDLSEEEDDNVFDDDPKARLIIQKMLSGKTARDIAIEEGLHTGEVELIINLYRTRYASGSDR